MKVCYMPPPTSVYRADHPFLYKLFGPNHTIFFIGMVLMMRCMPMPSPIFQADHPFLYVLLGPNRTTFFVGVYRGTA